MLTENIEKKLKKVKDCEKCKERRKKLYKWLNGRLILKASK
jgi:hypothetical protein